MEYLAVTSERIAKQSEVIAGKNESPEARKQRERAEAYSRQAKEWRCEFREVEERRAWEQHARHEEAKREATAKAQDNMYARDAKWEEDRQEEYRRQEAAREAKPLMVQERNGQQKPLVDFVRDEPRERPKSAARPEKEPKARPPQSRRTYYAVSPETLERAATMARNEGLEGISRAMEKDRPLAADVVRKLKPEDREGIRKEGDSHMREMVEQRETERQQERQQDMGRSRERD